jgi:hypothetical protein
LAAGLEQSIMSLFKNCSLSAFGVLGALTIAAPQSKAAISPPLLGVASDIHLTAGGCGHGRHKLLTGGCSQRIYNRTQAQFLNNMQPCESGHAVPSPDGAGYRCVIR